MIVGRILFAPLPARALSDPRLSALHFRVLGAIAVHDRLSDDRKSRKPGQGCWASHEKLKQEIGCDYSRLSTTIRDLGEWGYLERQVHPLNKRLRVYRVCYTDADVQFLARDSLPTGKVSVAAGTVGQSAKNSGSIVCQPKSQLTEDKEQSAVNIFRETENTFCGNRKNNSAEAARPTTNGEGNVGAQIAQFERVFRQKIENGSPFDQEHLARWHRHLAELCDTGDINDPTTQRACRLVSEVEEHLES